MNQLLDTILDKVNKQVDHAEIYMERNESVDVDILNDKVNHAKEENVLGIGIRIIKNQRQGFAYTTNLNKIDETIKQAINNSKLNQIDENISIIDSNKKYTKIDGLYDKQLENVDLQEFIDYSKTLIDLVKEKNVILLQEVVVLELTK